MEQYIITAMFDDRCTTLLLFLLFSWCPCMAIDVSVAGRPGSSEVPRNPLTRWDVSSILANGIFLTKKLKNKNKNAQRVEND